MRQFPREYVEWFHNKFRITYHYSLFGSIKEDHEVLIYLIEQHSLRTICEIGTFKGDTALLLWLYPLVKRVKCIDIHQDMGVEYNAPYQHKLMAKEEVGSMFKETFVELMFADTMKYTRGCEQHDLVFIDGNHDYEYIKNDTELALSWNPKIIVWHDYGAGNKDVIKYIDELVENGSKIEKYPNSLCVSAKFEDIKLEKK
jgi:hypothetical protein